MEMNQILKLVETVSNSRLTEFQYDADGVKLLLKKETPVIVQEMNGRYEPKQVENKTAYGAMPAESEGRYTAMQAGTDAPEEYDSGKSEGNLVKSPLVGTFYAAPSEEAEPFVQVGDQIQKGQVLAIVEAMKLMNDIESNYNGQVAEVFVKNGEAVEYGQPLFRIV